MGWGWRWGLKGISFPLNRKLYKKIELRLCSFDWLLTDRQVDVKKEREQNRTKKKEREREEKDKEKEREKEIGK